MSAAEVGLRALYVVHVATGVLALPTGYVALVAGKGGTVHRRSGMLFACTMLATTTAGAILALARHKMPEVNVPAAMLTFYFVLTSLLAVRPIAGWARRYDVVMLVAVIGVALVDLVFGVQAVAQGGRRHGVPAFPFFLFAGAGLLAAAGDVRVLRFGTLRGARRLARHLWRMSFALIVASLSIGQVKIIPKAVRTGPLFMIPPLLALVVMLWWLWRIRTQRSAPNVRAVCDPARPARISHATSP